MKFGKKIILSSIFLMLSAPSLAAVSVSDSTPEYGGSVDVTVSMAGTGNSFGVDMCGVEDVRSINVGNSVRSSYTFSNIKIPKEAPCGFGSQTIEGKAGTGTSISSVGTATIEVKADNMDPHKGDYIGMEIRTNSPTKQNMMMLTNDPWEGDNYPHKDSGPKIPRGGYIMGVYFYDGFPSNDLVNGVYRADYGEIIYQGDSAMSNILDSGDNWNNPDGDWIVNSGADGDDLWNDVIDQNFGSTNSRFAHNGCETNPSGIFPGTKYSFNSCSPIHKTDEYDTTGSIIKATSMEKSTIYGDVDVDPHADDYTNFYICRGDHSDGGYMGSTADESKIVQVQQTDGDDDWDYYRCANGDGSDHWSGATEGRWEEFTCPPGKEVRDTGTGNNPYGCRTASSGQSVDVNFFDLENVPESNRNGPLLGGFNISGSELNTFESALGHPVDTIEAECWLGQDDQRPGDGSQSVRITYDYADQSGGSPAWVLGKMPWRSNPDINKSTYSCVWGFTANIDDGDTNLLESTRRNPLNSKEASFTTTNHSLVKEKYETYSGSSISEETSSSVDIWDKYSGDDGRGSVDDTNEDMFSYSNAYPYCVTPTNPSGILSNIQCDSSGSVTASIDAEATTFEDGETIEFDASGSNSIKSIDSYNWDYGNGDTDTGATNQHSYSSTGTYTVEVAVEDVDGNTDTASTTIDIEDNVNTPGEFTVAYVPAYIQDSETTMYSNLVNSAHQSLEDNLRMDSSELTKYKVEQNTCHVTGCDGKGSCRQKAVDQCVNNGPIENDDYDLLHVICDNEDNYGGDSQPCGAQRGGVAKMAGDSAISLHNGDNSGYLGYGADYFGLSFSEVVVHEVGHNLGLEHVFNAEMLPDGALDVGELNIGDRVTDRTRTAAPGKGCYEVPDQYLKDDGSGWIVKAQHEEERGDGDRASPVSSTWKNLEDNNEGSDAINFFMSYCGVKDGFGPEAKEHMENNQLSGYQ